MQQNPVAGFTVVDNGYRNFTLNIVNIAGEIVFAKEYSTYSSTTELPVDVTKLARGIYQILVNNYDGLMKIRLVLE